MSVLQRGDRLVVSEFSRPGRSRVWKLGVALGSASRTVPGSTRFDDQETLRRTPRGGAWTVHVEQRDPVDVRLTPSGASDVARDGLKVLDAGLRRLGPSTSRPAGRRAAQLVRNCPPHRLPDVRARLTSGPAGARRDRDGPFRERTRRRTAGSIEFDTQAAAGRRPAALERTRGRAPKLEDGWVVDSRTAPSWGRRTRHHPDRPMPAAVWSGRRASDRRGRTR